MSSESVERSLLHASWPEWLQRNDGRNGMRWPFSWSRAASVFRFTSLLPALWRWSVRVGFLSAALLYASFSLLSDAEYKIGLQTQDIRHFQRAARLFPLTRTRRSAAAYAAILQDHLDYIPEVQWAIRHDPNAADLWFGLARMQLKAGDQIGYNSSLTRLKQLTPGLSFRVVHAAQ